MLLVCRCMSIWRPIKKMENKETLFKPYSQDQQILIPTDIRTLITEGHEVFLINQIFDEYIDWSDIGEAVSIRGARGYNPLMMLKILFYAYYNGIRSSRKIEELCYVDIRFMFLSGNQKPDHGTINNFRKVNEKKISEIFVSTIDVAEEFGLIGHKIGPIDGTKIKANASVSKTRTKKWIEEKKEEIEIYLKVSSEIDEEENKTFGDHSSTEIPQESIDRKEVSKKLKKLKHLKECEEKMNDEGKEKINTTDPEANIMKFADGSKKPAYNVQSMVDHKNQIITAIQVTDEPNDIHQLIPMLEESKENCGRLPEDIPADSGYFSYENIENAKKMNANIYIPDTRFEIDKEGKGKYFSKDQFCYDKEQDRYICPEGKEMVFNHVQRVATREVLRIYKGTACEKCSVKGKCTKANYRTISKHPKEYLKVEMRKKLQSEEGQQIYSMRKHIVETPFGDWKENNGFRQFFLRGKIGAKIEAYLFSAVHNMKKIVRNYLGGDDKIRVKQVNVKELSTVQTSLRGIESKIFHPIFGQNIATFSENLALAD